MRVTWPNSETASLHDAVVMASARTYEAKGISVHTPPYGSESAADLSLPALARVEEIETEDTLDKIHIDRLLEFRLRGLDVWVLVPLSRLGSAHDTLRGIVSRLQPWWLEGEIVRFGRPEQA